MGSARHVALVLAAVACAYATAFGATFHFDDHHVVVANPDVQSWRAWAASMPGIRALTKASFVASRALSPAAWSHVLLGVALHAAGAVLAYLLARRWLADLAPRAPVALAALVAALVFALHPAQAEAVTYIAGRSVGLAGALYLGAMLAFEARDVRRWAMPVSLCCFALALAARETAWTLPLALLLVESARGRPLRASVRALAPHFLLLAAAGVAMALSPTYRRLLRESLATRGPLDNLFAQVEGIAYLVTHPLLTLRVNFDPDVAVASQADAGWWLAAIAVVAAITVGFASLRRRPWLGLALLWFFLHLAPTQGAIARYDLVNDRHLYLALLGPALGIGVTVAAQARARMLAAAALIGTLALATIVRNGDYASDLALWQATVRASPGKSRPWNNLGWALQSRGRTDEARAAYARALALDPQNFRARANLHALSP